MSVHCTAVFVRALGVEYAEYVCLTADETQVSFDALAQLHSAVQGVTHHNHLVVTARRREYLVPAVFCDDEHLKHAENAAVKQRP